MNQNIEEKLEIIESIKIRQLYDFNSRIGYSLTVPTKDFICGYKDYVFDDNEEDIKDNSLSFVKVSTLIN